MHKYPYQSTCIEVEIKLSSIPTHSNTCGLKSIHMHPNKVLIGAENHEGLRNLPCMPAVDKGIEDWQFQNL